MKKIRSLIESTIGVGAIARSLNEEVGPRGGIILGYTSSGKPVYKGKHPKEYKDFEPMDHLDAADIQKSHSKTQGGPGNVNGRASHNISRDHKKYADRTESPEHYD